MGSEVIKYTPKTPAGRALQELAEAGVGKDPPRVGVCAAQHAGGPFLRQCAY